MARNNGRKAEQIRSFKITPDFQLHPAGSVLVEAGRTRVICAASLLDKVPGWMRAQKVSGGWLTAEYQMLPSATSDRGRRESSRGGPSGRTQEIQRLIGRCMRCVVDLEKLGSRTLQIDCDVIDADGGTRCASIVGASVATQLALKKLFTAGEITNWPFKEHIAAVSVGMLNGEELLDLEYSEDSAADVDMNVVMTESGKLVEVQGTAEGHPFSRQQMDNMMALADKGISDLISIQKQALATE
ncbi:MAG: ribonuclease PH [Lentisphaeria bacterium]